MSQHAYSWPRTTAHVAAVLCVLATVLVNAAPAANATTLGSRAVTIASYQKGDPYAWGHAGPDKFDCSGLTKYVYGRLGRYLPHSASRQYSSTYVTRVSKSSKAPGDLIFVRNSSGSIYHVTLYAGSGKWWEAARTGTTVRLVSMWTTNYSVGRVK